MQNLNNGQSAPMGRDADAKWVQWLAMSRRNNSRSTFGSSSDASSPSTHSKASSNMGDGIPLHPRSSATNYFSLLSANENNSNDARLFAKHKPNSSVSSLTQRDLDSSWAAWFNERWHQRQLADMPDRVMPPGAQGSTPPFPEMNKPLSPPQLQMHPKSIAPNPSTATTTSTQNLPSSAAFADPLPSSSLSNFLEPDIESLGNFNELLSDFSSALPFDLALTQSDPASGLYAPTGAFDDADLTWLEEQHAHPTDTNDESGKSTPASKRSREEYPGEFIPEGLSQLDDIASKKQKVFHPWVNGIETSPPYSSSALKPSR